MIGETCITLGARILPVALFGAGRHAQHHARAILRCAAAEVISDAEDIHEFNRLLTVGRIDALEATGGV